MLSVVNTGTTPFPYPYEEFRSHIKAMRTVREWEYTSRFGQVGTGQDSQAGSARVIEFFSDCYEDPREAVHKAELFLLIGDYIGRHTPLFARRGLLEQLENGMLAVDPALLRAVHHAFTVSDGQAPIAPKKVLSLARAFEEFA